MIVLQLASACAAPAPLTPLEQLQELASRGWRGIMTPKSVAQIERLRRGHTTISTTASTQEVAAA